MNIKTELIDIKKIKNNPNNPRFIRDEKFEKLVNSIKEFPKMLEIRPIVVNDKMIVLGGNMRLKACIEAGLTEVPVIKAKDLTKEEQEQFIIKDNVSGGEWDWDMIANEWDSDKLDDWGLDIPMFDEEEKEENDEDLHNPYTNKIKAPTYEPKNEKPDLKDIVNIEKYEELVEKIKASKHPKKIKDFLLMSATRHIVFNYELIADYYAHSDADIQELMEESALVIIDYNKAVENGFVKMTDQLVDLYHEDYDEE